MTTEAPTRLAAKPQGLRLDVVRVKCDCGVTHLHDDFGHQPAKCAELLTSGRHRCPCGKRYTKTRHLYSHPVHVAHIAAAEKNRRLGYVLVEAYEAPEALL